MEVKVLKEMQKRIVRNFLDVLILAQLRKEPKCGYGIVAIIHKKFHILMSTGTVYSTLYSLERDGLIQGNLVHRKRRTRVYTLTQKGEKTIEAFLKVNDKVQLFAANLGRSV